MANSKISQLTAATTPVAGTEVLPIVQSNSTVQVSIANLTAGRAVSASSLTLTTSPLGTGSGGTGLASFTSGGVVYASSASALTTGSALTFNGTNLKNTSGYISSSTDFRLSDLTFSRVAIGDGGGGFVGGYNITWSSSPVYDSTGVTAGIYKSANGTIQFYTGTSAAAGTAAPERARFDVNGNFGLNVTNPSALLDIGGNINSSGTARRFLADTSSTTIANRFCFQNNVANSNTQFHFLPNGTAIISSLGLNNNSDPTNSSEFLFQMNGTTECRLLANRRGTGSFLPISFWTSGAKQMQIDTSGNVQVGTAALATTATDGFLYIPTCAGAPTGTPTAKTGLVPMIYDSTNNNFYIYNGAWKKVALT